MRKPTLHTPTARVATVAATALATVTGGSRFDTSLAFENGAPTSSNGQIVIEDKNTTKP